MFLETLNRLMAERNLNKNSLAKESGIPYTTIDGFYKKGCENVKLSTLTRLASFFDVSLDFLVNGTITNISDQERRLLLAYRNNPSMQEAVDRILGICGGDPTVAKDISEEIESALSRPATKK